MGVRSDWLMQLITLVLERWYTPYTTSISFLLLDSPAGIGGSIIPIYTTVHPSNSIVNKGSRRNKKKTSEKYSLEKKDKNNSNNPFFFFFFSSSPVFFFFLFRIVITNTSGQRVLKRTAAGQSSRSLISAKKKIVRRLYLFLLFTAYIYLFFWRSDNRETSCDGRARGWSRACPPQTEWREWPDCEE